MTKRAPILSLVAAAWILWGPSSLSAGPPFSAENLTRAMNAREDWAALDVQLGDYLPVPFSKVTPRRTVDAFVKHGLVTATLQGGTLFIRPTAKGEALARAAQLPPRPGHLRIRGIRFQATKLIKSEALTSPTGSWRHVLFTYTRDAEPVLIDAQTEPFGRDRKGRALLEYDEFKSQWAMRYWKVASIDEELDSSSIDQDVVNLGLRRE